nr:acyltransferase [uncultured Aquabacterium sp.]
MTSTSISVVASSSKPPGGAQPTAKSENVENGKRLIFLEYLRVYAFLNVIGTHIFHEYLHIEAQKDSGAALTALLNIYNAIAPTIFGSATGVPVFFLVSGYIIFNVSERESPSAFAIKRILRIYPLYIIAVLMQFLIVDGQLPGWGHLRPRLSLLGDFTGTGNVLNGVDWTLRIEILFYAFVFATAFLSASPAAKKLKPHILPLTIFACLALPAFPQGPNTVNACLPHFMVGAALYYHEQRRLNLTTLVSLTTLVLFTTPGKGNTLGVGLFFAAWTARDWLPQSRLIVSLASISYAVYLLHAWFIVHVTDHTAPIFQSKALAMSFAFLLMFAICYLLHFTIEKPFMSVGRSLSKSIANAKSKVNHHTGRTVSDKD